MLMVSEAMLMLVFSNNFLEFVHGNLLLLKCDFLFDEFHDLLASELIVETHEILTVFVLKVVVCNTIQTISNLLCKSLPSELCNNQFFCLATNLICFNR